MIIQRLKNKLHKTQTGLLPLKKDSRDLGFWNIFGSYEPKYDKKELDIFSIKKQSYNTCTFASVVGAKEIDEQVSLSIRFLVIKAKEAGYISGNGFSTVRNAQKALNKFGTCESRLLSENADNWADYSNPKYITREMENNAITHKSKSYAFLSSINDVYKAIDDGRPVQTGIDWYSGYQGSAFKLPWIIYKITGWKIGGHALYICGYNKSYKKQFVVKKVNSFGTGYADGGKFYMTVEMMSKYISKYGAGVNLDMEIDTAKWLSTHQGNNVEDSGGNIYFIENGKKLKYPDMATFISHNGNDNDFVIVDDNILALVEDGADMDFFKGIHYLSAHSILKRIKDNTDTQEFKKYFPDLY